MAARLEIRVFEPLDTGDLAAASAFCRRLSEQNIACRPTRSIEDAAPASDVIVTTTPARAPVVRREWLAPGVHVNAMGADTAGKQEHEVASLRDCLVIVDDWAQARSLGECQHGLAAGLYSDENHPASIGQIIEGQCPGRSDDQQMTLFDATGLALQDLATAELALHVAEERQAGTFIRLD